MAYTYEQIFAADPSDAARVATNGVVTIFAPGDPARTPLVITTVDGLPLSNPMQVNDVGYGPAFMHATLDRVAWAGGGPSGFFTSYDGMKDEAVAARQAAQAAALEAGAPTDAMVERGIQRADIPGRVAAQIADGPIMSGVVAEYAKTPGNPLNAVLPVVLGSVFGSGHAGTLFVSADGHDSRSGLIPNFPKRTIESALDALGAGEGEIVLLPRAGAHTVTKPLRIEGNRHRIVGGYGAVINASAITSGAVFHIGSDAPTAYRQVRTPLENFELVGNSKTGNATAIYMDEPGIGASHFSFTDLNIHDFGTGVALKDNAYILNFDHVSIWNTSTGLKMLGDQENGGERITFNHSTIFNSILGIYGGHGEVFLVDTSLDYNEVMIDSPDSRVTMYACHVETYPTRAQPLFKTSGQAGSVKMIGGTVTLNGPTGVATIPAIIDNNSSYNAGSRFIGVNFNNCLTKTGYFATGNGYTATDDDLTYGGTSLNYEVFSAGSNLLMDGGFEGPAIIDSWFLTGDTQAATGSLIGKNIAVTSSTDLPRSGSRSLKITKIGGAGSEASVTIAVPIPRGAKPRYRFYLSKPGSADGTVHVNATFAVLRDNGAGPPIVVSKSSRLANDDLTLPSAPLEWTKVTPRKPIVRAPIWATHFLLEIRLYTVAANGESIFVDDLEISL